MSFSLDSLNVFSWLHWISRLWKIMSDRCGTPHMIFYQVVHDIIWATGKVQLDHLVRYCLPDFSTVNATMVFLTFSVYKKWVTKHSPHWKSMKMKLYLLREKFPSFWTYIKSIKIINQYSIWGEIVWGYTISCHSSKFSPLFLTVISGSCLWQLWLSTYVKA